MASISPEEITWAGDPIANWTIVMREAREEEDVETVEELLDTEIEPGPGIPQIEGLTLPVCDRREVQIAMVKSVVEIVSFHGFEDFQRSAVNHLSSAMANYMEDLCNHIRINRYYTREATNRCSFLHAAAVTLLRSWRFTVKPKNGLRGIVEWYDQTYRKPAMRAEISARKWVEWMEEGGGERGDFVEPQIELDEEKKDKMDEEKIREERTIEDDDGENSEDENDEKEEDYLDLLTQEEHQDRVEEKKEEEEKEEEKKKEEEKEEEEQVMVIDQNQLDNMIRAEQFLLDEDLYSDDYGEDLCSDDMSDGEHNSYEVVKHNAMIVQHQIDVIRGNQPLGHSDWELLQDLESNRRRVGDLPSWRSQHPLLRVQLLQFEQLQEEFGGLVQQQRQQRRRVEPCGGNIVEEVSNEVDHEEELEEEENDYDEEEEEEEMMDNGDHVDRAMMNDPSSDDQIDEDGDDELSDEGEMNESAVGDDEYESDPDQHLL